MVLQLKFLFDFFVNLGFFPNKFYFGIGNILFVVLD